MQPAGVKVSLPASVNVYVQPTVDLRLPHKNPLVGEEGHLFDMRDDVLRVIDGPRFGHVLLIGSSGCGKTTTAFLVARERYCVFLECLPSAAPDCIQPFHISSDALKKPRGVEQFPTIERRMWRELLARCTLLAILHRRHKITPYQWLLLSISDNEVYREMLRKMRAVFDGVASVDFYASVMEAVARELGYKPSVIIDEAHLLVEDDRSIVIKDAKGASDKVDTFGATVMVLSQKGVYFASCMWIGTQVGLEQSARLTSAVFKTDGNVPLYAFCSFPYITTERFAELAVLVLGKEFVFAAYLLYGRARTLATLIRERVMRPNVTAEKVVNETRKQSHLVREIARVLNGEFGTDNLLDLWMAAINYDENGETFSPERFGGTLPFTQKFSSAMDVFGDFKTGGQLTQPSTGFDLDAPRLRLAFVHVVDEPALVDAISDYFILKGGDSPYHRLYERAVDSCVNFKGEPSIRGMLLDVAVLCKVVSLGRGTKLSSWLPLQNARFDSVREATFGVTQIVSGKGVLYRWLEAVLYRPEEEFVPGVAAKNVCVRPEILAGADGAFAAFVGKSIVIVTIACAWYSDRLPKKKWEDQAKRSSDLRQQFKFKNAAKVDEETAEKKAKRGIARKKAKNTENARNLEMVELLDKASPRTLRILFELPSRKGKNLPKDYLEGDALVVDVRNAETILGGAIKRNCDSELVD